MSDTILTATASKITPSPGSPEPPYEGCLIFNKKVYEPGWDFDSEEFALLSQNAEWLTSASSRIHGDYNRNGIRQGFAVQVVSSGYAAIALIHAYKDQVLRNALARMGRESNEAFLTQQRMGDVLPSEIMQHDIIKKAMAGQKSRGALLKSYNPNIAWNLPAYREGSIRSQKESFAATHGTDYQDWAHEWHYALMLHLGVDVMANIGNEWAYSRLGQVEDAVSSAMRFGLEVPMAYRMATSHRNIGLGNMDKIDRFGRSISPYDEIVEPIKAMWDLVDNGLRCETHAARVLQFFMYYDWAMNKDGPINRRWIHPDVNAHFESDSEVHRMETLKADVLQWMAHNVSNWKTLMAILDVDRASALKAYWDEKVKPLIPSEPNPQARQRSHEKLRDLVMPYLPRGGWDAHPKYAEWVTDGTDKDADVPPLPFRKHTPRIALSVEKDLFDTAFAPQLFDDSKEEFRALGPQRSSSKSADRNTETIEQVAARSFMTLHGEFHPPEARPYTAFYIGSASAGVRVQQWMQDNNVRDPKEATGERVNELAVNEAADLEKARLRLIESQWAQELGISKILTPQDSAKAMAELAGTRQALGLERREAFKARGGNKMGRAAHVVDAKTIDQIVQYGIVRPGAIIDDNEASLLFHALQVRLGKTERAHSGGKYDLHMFYDAHNGMSSPRKMDFADYGILFAHTVNKDLDEEYPVGHRVVLRSMARWCHMFESSPAMDPSRLNTKRFQHAASGDEKTKEIIDWEQVAQHDPEFLSFIDYDAEKLARVRAIYDEMMNKDYSWMQQTHGFAPPVRGKLLVRGTPFMQHEDFKGLRFERQAEIAKEWTEGVEGRFTWRPVHEDIHVSGPAIEGS